MRWLVAVALAVLLAGCICAPQSKDVISQPTTTLLTEGTITPPPEVPSAPLTAKKGLKIAKQKMLSLRPDAILVGVSGTAGLGGVSADWEYQFDSLQGRKGYTLDASGETRERPYSFRADLGSSWADSDTVASLCKADAGEFSLEVQNGKRAWTVIAGEKTCLVDAESGALLGGGE